MSERIPPHSIEAEEAVLGAMMVEPNAILVVAGIAKPQDFYGPVHVTIAETIYGLEAQSKPVNKFAVLEALRAQNQLDRCGGPAYLSRLFDQGLEASGSAEYFAKIIAEKSQLRRMIAAGKKIYQLGFDGEGDVAGALAEAEAQLQGVLESTLIGDDGEWAEETAHRIYREMDSAMAGERKKAITLPWYKVQKHTGGLYGGEVLVIAAAPGMGKSAMAAQIATHTSVKHGSVALYALEMGKDDTIRRLISTFAKVNVREIRAGAVSGSSVDRVFDATTTVAGLRIKTFGSMPQKSTSDIRRLSHRVKSERGLSLIIVDHPGYLREAGLGFSKASKHERYEDAYIQLKLIAAELDVPIVIIQHLNRDGMDRRPVLKDLRDGGNLEGHAHMVFFPYRPDVANNPTQGELFIAKNRDGETGTIPMQYGGSDFVWSESVSLGGVA